MNNVLEVEHVVKEYESGVRAVDDVSFCLPRGGFWSIMGASGSGKTTLLNLIATIDRLSAGTISVRGQSLAELKEEELACFRREHLGFIVQDYNLLDTLTLRENIALALTIQKWSKQKITQRVTAMAGALGIQDVLDQFPYQVSGGQRQRCACARALAAEPELVLADEPTGALDSQSAQIFMAKLGRLNRELNTTILMVTHDALSASHSEHILFMCDGRIVGELRRGDKDRRAFFLEILDWQAGMIGRGNHVS